MNEQIVNTGKKKFISIFILIFIVFPPVTATADGLRNITVATYEYHFNDTWLLSLEDIFLARIAPRFTIQAKIARYQTDRRFQHVLSVGPVVNLSSQLYIDALYGLGYDSNEIFEHRWNANLNYETDNTLLQVGVRGAITPDTDYYYIIPSMGGKFQLIPLISFLNKIFLSWDNNRTFAGSYWGELEWHVSKNLDLRSGATFTWSETTGFSIIAGANIRVSHSMLLKYHFKYLSDEINYSSSIDRVSGIENSLYLDFKF
jgi:hypothetical protein